LSRQHFHRRTSGVFMSSEPLARGDRQALIGRYEVIKRIGAGGMGAVYRAIHLDLGREVALKVLPPDLAARPEMLERFLREAQHAAKLRHEHIVTLYESGEANGTHYLAMEFVDGINLHEYIEQKGRLDPNEARKITIQAAKALALAHEEGIVHRDIKPSNFLLTQKDGKPFVKLTDFGLALSLDNSDFRVTQSGTTVGTVDYISPEQARNSRNADIRSDIYSLGCTLFHMLTGQPPFAQGDLTERLLKHVEAPPPDVKTFNPDIPDGLTIVLKRMLSKKPEDRYQTPLDLLNDLEHLPRGAVWNSRELLEGLALAEGERPKSAKPSGAETRKFAVLERTRPIEIRPKPGPLPKPRYRKEPPKKERINEIEFDLKLPAFLQSWKTWTAVAGCVALALTIAVAIILVQRSRHLEPVKAANQPPVISYSQEPAPETRADSARTVATYGEIKPDTRNPDNVQKTSEPGSPQGPETAPQEQRLPRIYEPPPETVARMRREFEPPPPSVSRSDNQVPSTSDSPPRIASSPPTEKPVTPDQPSTQGPAPVRQAKAPTATPASRLFVVQRFQASREPSRFDSLAAACAAAPADQETIIEIADNGPLFEEPIDLANRTIVIRAAKGYRPLIAWHTSDSSASGAGCLISLTGGNLILEGLDLVVKCPGPGKSQLASLLRMDGGGIVAQDCTFSIAGRQDGPVAAIQFGGAHAAGGQPVCRLTHCFLRGSEMTALDLRAAGADVVLDGCLAVGGGRPLIDIVGRGSANPSRIRVARSTLIASQTLVHIGHDAKSNKEPALQWLGWDSLLARFGIKNGGDLLALDEGASVNAIQWHAANCLYTGWENLLKTSGQTISRGDLRAWRALWHENEGDDVAAQTWPALVPAELGEAAPAAFRVIGTHASFAATSGSGALGCDVAVLPRIRGGWLSLTYDPLVSAPLDISAPDQAPEIPVASDNLYHGERLDISQLDLGNYLRELRGMRRFGARVVLHLTGKGECRTSPIYVKGTNLVLYFESSRTQGGRLTLVPKDNVDREALIEVEGGCEMINAAVTIPDSRIASRPAYLLKVRGGDLRLSGCRLQGPLDQGAAGFSGLIYFDGSGETTSARPHDGALADCVFLSGKSCIQSAGACGNVRVQNSLIVAGGDAFQIRPPLPQDSGVNAAVIVERSTIAAKGAAIRVEDVILPSPTASPMIVQARNCLFLAPFSAGSKPSRLLALEGNALAHGLVVWQGEANGYDRRVQLMWTLPGSPAISAESLATWKRLWGPATERRTLTFELPATTPFELQRPEWERLTLPSSAREKMRGPAPGADLAQLGLTNKL